MNRHKYNARKTTVDGITFDSKAEADYYKHLQFLEKSGEIDGFRMQVRFNLIPSFNHPTKRNKDGKPSKVRAVNYVPDFVIEKGGEEYVVDVKGMRTADFNLKAKMFMHKYGIPLYLAKKKGRGFDVKPL
ncbi:DUF1064 domain-containing protein [Aerococcaceae bacterium DSM 111020]|nr:DUF1064 domain-containing protein [Aerococcaceae bacterium DSM 111020]